MTYRAPVAEMAFTIRQVAGLDRAVAEGLHGDLTADLAETILEEAGRFASDVLAPLNRVGDRHGTPLRDGVVTMPPGFREAYRAWSEAGWNALPGPEAYGGQGLPLLLNAACIEMWNAASMSFGLGPLLTAGGVEALSQHGSEDLRARYLEKLVTGEWTATMNLTEPQAGSDLSAVTTRAVKQDDGTYRITGTKIFITYGDHDLAPNIIHLVLARLPDAPAGTRGISLFLVPKRLVNDDGSLGGMNDVLCTSLEHKLGIHGSPTAVMKFGETTGAVGYLIGEENRGLNTMFIMMNAARLAVGIQGVAVAERATQKAIRYAKERRQGRASPTSQEMLPIIEHPDVRRTIMTMRAMTQAARAICYVTAAELDVSRRAAEPAERRLAADRLALLTPVAKAFSTDVGCEVASLAVQVHGGMGFIEETGIAQLYRDARILPIYEGTNGIQAVDLVTRKLPLQEGRLIKRIIGEFEATAQELKALNRQEVGRMGQRLASTVAALREATDWMHDALASTPKLALASATPYLRLLALAAGGHYLAKGALTALREAGPTAMSQLAVARFFAENVSVAGPGLAVAITSGSLSALGPSPELLDV